MKKFSWRRRRRPRSDAYSNPLAATRPELIFSPHAWLKWQLMCHSGDTEVAGFGLSNPHHPLYLDDILVVRQRASNVTVSIDDDAVADLFDDMTDRGIPPNRFARIWLHTHPNESVIPSSVDEATFIRCFGHCDWAVMSILGRTGRTYARLRFDSGPGMQQEIPSRVDWSAWPALMPELPLRLDEWQEEYDTHIQKVEFRFEPFGNIWFDSGPMTANHFNLPPVSDFTTNELDFNLPGVKHDVFE